MDKPNRLSSQLIRRGLFSWLRSATAALDATKSHTLDLWLHSDQLWHVCFPAPLTASQKAGLNMTTWVASEQPVFIFRGNVWGNCELEKTQHRSEQMPERPGVTSMRERGEGRKEGRKEEVQNSCFSLCVVSLSKAPPVLRVVLWQPCPNSSTHTATTTVCYRWRGGGQEGRGKVRDEVKIT